MHKYNNQDHSMLTAMLTVENILGKGDHDIWAVNVDEDYHEETGADAGSANMPPGDRLAKGTGREAPIIPRSASRS
jgi:hypothetical protein